MKPSPDRAGAIESISKRNVFLAAALLLFLVPAAHAATLDTPALLDLTNSGNFICNFTNLDSTKTAILNASGSSGLIQDDGVVLASFVTSLSVPPGQTATTIRSACSRSGGGLEHAAACRCHFEFTGVGKSKVRAALSTDVAGSVAAD